MYGFTSALICILIIKTAITYAQLPSFRCTVESAKDTCVFRDIQLSRDQFRFIPEAEHYNFERVDILTPSYVEVFGPDICNTFPNLKLIELGRGIGLEELSVDVVDNCKNLTVLRILESKISAVDRELFSKLPLMKTLSLTYSLIKTLPFDTFSDLTEMYYLDMKQGALETFHPNLVKTFRELEVFILESNELSDLDIETIIEYSPSLRYVWIADNPIKCSRFQEIKNALRERRINNFFSTNPKQNRTVPLVEDNDGFLCLAD